MLLYCTCTVLVLVHEGEGGPIMGYLIGEIARLHSKLLAVIDGTLLCTSIGEGMTVRFESFVADIYNACQAFLLDRHRNRAIKNHVTR